MVSVDPNITVVVNTLILFFFEILIHSRSILILLLTGKYTLFSIYLHTFMNF